jgi:hypothetical protein
MSGSVQLHDLFSGEERVMAADNLVVSLDRASGGAWRVRPG